MDVIAKGAIERLLAGQTELRRDGIDPLSLAFRQVEEENEYRTETLQATLGHMRLGLIFAIALIAGYGLFDPLIFSKRETLNYVLTVRFAIVLPPPVFFLLISFHSQYEKYSQAAGVLGIGLAGVGFFLIAINSDSETLIYTFPAVVMVTLFAFFFSGLFFVHALISSAFVNGIYLLPIWTIGVPIAFSVAVNSIMLTLFFFVAMAAYQRELTSRELFGSQKRERETLAKQVRSNTRYLEWLRQLAGFLRHEVRQPVAQINSSIEIARLSVPDESAITPYLDRASTGAEHVWNLVERASQATDMVAFVHRSRRQRIEIVSLIRDQVQAFTRTHSGVSFRFRDDGPVVLFADPTLVTEAISNLLSNAVSFANEESTIDLIMTTGARTVLIEVTNKGPLIEGDANDCSTRSRPPERDPRASTRALDCILSDW
jgi:signal transduction histidine kinase